MTRVYPFIIASCFLLSSCYAIRAYKYRNLKLTDNVRMPHVPVSKGDNTSPFIIPADAGPYARMKKGLDSILTGTYTAAFLVIRNDSLIYEGYFDGFNKESQLPSFSVSKSFTAILVGIAIDEGKIASVQDPMTKYLPEFAKKDPRFSKITIQHLLDMRGGLLFHEGDYGLKDDAIKMGFSPNITAKVRKIKIEKDPGGDMEYQSVNTQLLGMIIERATGKKISQYLQEKIWQPLGMESDAFWTTDKRKQELVYGGMNATARDYAKLGRLMLNNGAWNGKQVVSTHWINASVSSDSLDKYEGYRNQWWGVRGYKYFNDSADAVKYKETHMEGGSVRSYLDKKSVKRFYVPDTYAAYQAEGILGQFIYINPAKNLVIVRLGHNWKNSKYPYVNGFISSLGNEL
ncbi:MAG: serine hydrolase [Chitinophagaceae bacterium]